MGRLSREVAMELEKRRVRKAVLSGKEEDIYPKSEKQRRTFFQKTVDKPGGLW